MPHRFALTLMLALAGTALLTGFEWAGRIHRLESELASGDPVQRREVVRLLAHYRAERVGTLLLSALADPDAGVRAEAARSAGRVGLTSAIPTLLEWLEDPDAEIRASAAFALGHIGSSQAIPSLVRALGDAEVNVRRAAVEALRAVGGAQVVVPVLGRLDDQDPAVRTQAAHALAELGDPRAVVPLIGRARDDSPEVRIAVATALGALRDPRAAAALLPALDDGNEAVQLAVIAALGQLASEAAVDSLAARTRDTDPRITRATLTALGAIASDEAISVLIQALAHDSSREPAIDVLISITRRRNFLHETDAASALTQRLAHALDQTSAGRHADAIATVLAGMEPNEASPAAAGSLLRHFEVRRIAPTAIMSALAVHGEQDALVPLLEELSSDAPHIQDAALTALERYFDYHPTDGQAADPLAAALPSVAPRNRARILRLLGRVGAQRSVETLRPLLHHEDLRLRLAAVRALGLIGAPSAAPDLLTLLDYDHGRIRYLAAQALGSSASEDVIQTLLQRLADPAPIDRHVFILAIGAALSTHPDSTELSEPLRSQVYSVLDRIARGRDPELAARAIVALGQSRDPAVTPLLISRLESGPSTLRRQAAHALALHGTPSGVASLRSQLSTSNVTVAASVAIALGEQGDGNDVPSLLDAIDERQFPVSAAASFALFRLARRGHLNGEYRDRLCDLTERRDPYVRTNLASTLTAIGAGPCPNVDPRNWYTPRNAPIVRGAAMRWLAGAAVLGEIPVAAAERVLDECATRDLAPEVAAACRDPRFPPLDDTADVYAYAPDGETILRDHLIALRLADGSVLVTHTDRNGHVRLERAPRGTLQLDDPLHTPLEP